MKYEVVIVGCGPAGASLGYLLLKNQVSVAIIDKNKFPRKKLCGGLFTYKTKKLYEEIFNKDFSSYANSTKTINFFLQNDLIANFQTKLPFYLVDRYNFDFELYNNYINEGGICYCGNTISSIDTENKLIVLNNGDKIEYNILVGADGANSQIRKLIDRKYKPNGFCLEIEQSKIKKSDLINIHFGCVDKGYGWYFNKNTFSTIGFGGEYEKTKLQSILNSKNNIFKYYNIDNKNVKGAFIPFGKFLKKPCRDNIILIGDAAGFVDPITGEGLYFCFKSSILACQAIIEYKKSSKNFPLAYYYLNLIGDIHKRIEEANRLKKIIFNKFFQNLFFPRIKKHLSFAAYICDSVISTYSKSYRHLIINYLLERQKK